MICAACRKAADTNNIDLHNSCRGGTWCDCGHKRVKLHDFEQLEDTSVKVCKKCGMWPLHHSHVEPVLCTCDMHSKKGVINGRTVKQGDKGSTGTSKPS